MSTLINDAAMVPALRSGRPATGTHQSNSWPILATLLFWMERHRQRNALRSRVDDKRLLDDIGLSRELVLRETDKACWQ